MMSSVVHSVVPALLLFGSVLFLDCLLNTASFASHANRFFCAVLLACSSLTSARDTLAVAGGDTLFLCAASPFAFGRVSMSSFSRFFFVSVGSSFLSPPVLFSRAAPFGHAQAACRG